MADKLVFKKVQKAIGLERCKIFVVGSAPIRRVVHDFFMSFNMPLMEAYGMISLHIVVLSGHAKFEQI